jgi:ATP-dependent helicase/nuclease subunit B
VAPLEANPPNRPPSELQAAALHCLEQGGAVITGNARAARSLRHSHAAAQQANGRRAWPTPLIHDWESWLSILWHQRLQSIPDAPILLTPLQEGSLWKRIAGESASDSEANAKLAQKAWNLLGDFNAHGERNQSWAAAAASDSEVFRGWASTFDRECRSNRWLSRSNLTSLLTESIEQGRIEVPREILLIGLDRFTPSQQMLIDTVRMAGTIVRELEQPPTASSPQLVQAKELRDELTICAWWLRAKLEENPAASIAVVLQDAEAMRGEVHRIFRAILMPQSVSIESNEAMPFEFSLGVPLATVPLVKAALLALRWLAEPLEQAAISWLTISSFLTAKDEDLLDMAQFDAELRKHSQLPPETSLDAFLRYGPRLGSPTVRQFRNRLRALQREAEAEGVTNRRRTFPEWITVAEVLLRQLRWPGARTLESNEFQARARWERLLDEIATLGFDGGRVGWSEFVTALDRYASETIFAPESHGMPIQIMSPLESAGQNFDALWFLGADDAHWPAAGQPNPLLPLWLQRKAEMPHSSLDVDWAVSLAVTQRLASSAAECVFSYALRDDDGELRPSALVGEALGHALQSLVSDKLRARMQVLEKPRQRSLTVEVEDESSIPWPKDIHAGGAEILKRQSACAFRSFAVRRLGAEELRSAGRGLTPQERGNIAHSVLQALWSKQNAASLLLQSRDDLIEAKAGGRLPEILRHHIAEIFERELWGGYKDGGWAQAYLQVEQVRLQSVLLQWLDSEMERKPFTVEVHEKSFRAQVNGLELDLRVDRIDRVQDGRLILDYKTGKVSPAMWEGARPEEPQLPLYGVHGPVDDLRGVLFAQVRAGEMTFAGRLEDASKALFDDLSARSGLAQKPLTEEVLGGWADALSGLAHRFLAGEAAVAPKRYPKTCKYCTLPAFCRVAETLVEHESEHPDTDEGGLTELQEGDVDA